MKLAEAGENYLLRKLRKRFGKKSPGLILGIGDDAAVISMSCPKILVTTDMMAEGVHFDLRWTTPFQIGFKLVSVNVSDIYAMGGEPRFLLLSFSADGNFQVKQFDRLFEGIKKASALYGISLIGGDISSSERMTLSATVLGCTSGKILRRDGARPGDFIYVTGHLGDSACGLELLKKMKVPIPDEGNAATCRQLSSKYAMPLMRRHVMPVAVKPDRFIRHATAMMDISDGLVMDLSRICSDSRVGAKIYTERLPLSRELVKASEYLKKDPIDLALGGGEDYELLFTSASKTISGAYCIGEITRSGMRVMQKDGRQKKISHKGYQHFAL
jgi:thiamine-monophosphate kinase